MTPRTQCGHKESGAHFFLKYWIPTEPGDSFDKEKCISLLAGQNRLLRAQGSSRGPLPAAFISQHWIWRFW